MKLNHFYLIAFTSLIFFSCSSDDNSNKTETNPITINSIESSKQLAFIEETIAINIDAIGYEAIDVTNDNNNTTITKINNTTYHINATEMENVTINVTLSYEDFTETEAINLSFLEHGVINHKIVEGLTLDVDSPDKALTLLGTPEAKTINEDDNEETWYYFEKGFWILMDMNVNQVHYIRLYGYDTWTRTIDNVNYKGNYYPYEIGDGLNISNLQLTMDTVIETYGQPTEKFSSSTTGSTLRVYDYEDIETLFYFNSNSIDNYTGKTVGYINVY